MNSFLRARMSLVCGSVCVVAACSSQPAPADGTPSATPVYNPENGRLEQLVQDANGDGKPDTRGYLDGAQFTHVDIDRDGDGKPDRWEYYTAVTSADVVAGARILGPSILVRAEEANGGGTKITRREFYLRGVIERVEEDTDGDGKTDKWETYKSGALVTMDLDLTGRGTPTRRLIYSAGGNLDHVETDEDGDGRFEVLKTPATAASDSSTRAGGRAGGRP